MIGVIGTAPEHGRIPTLEAGDHGGNLDTREVCQGSVVHLPVRVPGGLLLFGDVHAAMGDGEVSGSGVEIAATVRIRVNIKHDVNLPRPRVETQYHLITLATRENIHDAVKMVTVDMISWIQEISNLTFRDALLLVGAAGSLRFNQVINKPGPTIKLIMEKSRLR